MEADEERNQRLRSAYPSEGNVDTIVLIAVSPPSLHHMFLFDRIWVVPRFVICNQIPVGTVRYNQLGSLGKVKLRADDLGRQISFPPQGSLSSSPYSNPQIVGLIH